MGDVFLTEAAHWLRAAGCNVIEFDDWKYRCKSSGGYNSGRPWGCMWHHTGSNNSAESESHYMCYGADAAPIANVCIDRNGDVWLLAGGPTNTNGSGDGVSFSKGSVPGDSMNSYAFGIEICNNGGGGSYSQAQVDAAFAVSNAINAHCGNQPDDVALHYTWAPDRKVDPSKASAVEGPWQPGSVNNSGTWNLSDLKAECRRRAGGVLPGPTPEPEDDMPLTLVQCRDADAAFYGPAQLEPLILGTMEWTGPGSAWRAPAIIAGVTHKAEIGAADMTNVTLVGDIPTGDRYKDWNERDFYAVIPKR